MVGPVVMVVELREELAAYAPGRLAPRELLGHVWEGETDRAQPLNSRWLRSPTGAA
jgi:hypothetical protein